jgi:hypothetical protein
VFRLGAVNVNAAFPFPSVTTSPTDNVPAVVVTTSRRDPSAVFEAPSRKFTRTVDCELPSRGTISGDAVMVI